MREATGINPPIVLPLPTMRLANYMAILCGAMTVSSALAQNNTPSPTVPRVIPLSPRHVEQPIDQSLNNPVMPNVPTLAFDAESKQFDANPGDPVAPFVFSLTNVWSNSITIFHVHASCGCTTAKLPHEPWVIPPGGNGQISAQINLAGKMGLVTKTLTLFTSVGNRILTLKVKVPSAMPGIAQMSAMDRKSAQEAAMVNQQAIFRGECATCHVNKGARAFGQDLYAADCGICHESSHRASAVPDLHALKHPTNLDYWKAMITFGKPHTMMPGFALAQGGPLTDEQITSLATYLDRTISHHFRDASMTNAAAAPPVARHF